MDRIYSLVSDLTLAVSWVGTVSVALASICSPRQGPADQSLSSWQQSAPLTARAGRLSECRAPASPPAPTSHCWLYAGSGALNSLAPAACWHWLYCVQCTVPCTVLHWTHLAATDIINTSGLCTPSTKANLNKKHGCISLPVKVNTCNNNFFSKVGTSEYFSHRSVCNIIYCKYLENIFVCECLRGWTGLLGTGARLNELIR